MSNPFLIYISEINEFDRFLVLKFLNSCSGISEFKERPDEFALYVADFYFENDISTFELKSNLKTVVIRGTGIAGIKLCYLFQQFYPKPLHLIDEAYCFDFLISDFDSIEKLSNAINEATIGR